MARAPRWCLFDVGCGGFQRGLSSIATAQAHILQAHHLNRCHQMAPGRVGHQRIAMNHEQVSSDTKHAPHQWRRLPGGRDLRLNAEYQQYFHGVDPISPLLHHRKDPLLVERLISRPDLLRTEYFTDFLARYRV